MKTAFVFKLPLCPGGTIIQRQHDRHLYQHIYTSTPLPVHPYQYTFDHRLLHRDEIQRTSARSE
ncbi:MAG: hypothetical protein HOI11_17010 [Gammaproteobacteria bacterium]|nr:hypothetical protein [Gammaproteobacteria bacterium]MBT5792168.1 hypothetical protein [Gammaproteobacteria bacterium]